MIWQPSPDFRYALKRGMSGTDCAALQLNLGDLLVDGDFGRLTERAVRRFQRRHPRLVTDGIAGPATQAAVASREMRDAAATVPEGLLKSLAFNESALILGSCGKHSQDSGWDVGVFARSTGKAPGTQEFLRSCYDVTESAEWSAENLRDSYEKLGVPVESWYTGTLAGGRINRYRWQLAVFMHNWPAGALNLARRGAVTVDYVGDRNTDDEPAAWIIAATGGRLETPREWVLSYVARSTTYVRW